METRLRTSSGRLAFFVVMTALTTVANLVMVPMPQPLAEYDLSPVLTYTLGVTVDPVLAAVIVAAAMMLGTGYKVITFGFPIVFVPGAMLVRGLEAMLISYIVRMKSPVETKTVTTWDKPNLEIDRTSTSPGNPEMANSRGNVICCSISSAFSAGAVVFT